MTMRRRATRVRRHKRRKPTGGYTTVREHQRQLNLDRFADIEEDIEQDLQEEKIVKYGFEMPEYLEPYTDKNMPPNAKVTFPSSNRCDAYDINARFYGTIDGEPFGPEHLTRENFDVAVGVHDAPHSVALFLNELKKNKDRKFALHNKVPFEFPYGTEYVKYYTQKYNFPLVITDVKDSRGAKDQLLASGVPTRQRRWCTRVYKIAPTKSFYKNFDLDGIEERFGITRHQSTKRKDKNPEKHYSDKCVYTSGKRKGQVQRFKIYESLPIFNMKEEEMLETMDKHNIKPVPIFDEIKGMDLHGCMWCQNRRPEYYQKLRKEHPEMYAKCEEWRELGSQSDRFKEKNPEGYYWFCEGRGSKLSKKKKREKPELINIM